MENKNLEKIANDSKFANNKEEGGLYENVSLPTAIFAIPAFVGASLYALSYLAGSEYNGNIGLFRMLLEYQIPIRDITLFSASMALTFESMELTANRMKSYMKSYMKSHED